MAQILVKAINNIQNDGRDKVRYQRGYPVVVMPDKHTWGKAECLPDFIVVKLPGVPIEKVKKYIEEWNVFTGSDKDGNPRYEMSNRRRWIIRWDDLPLSARDKLKNNGELIIKAVDAYEGIYDYTWLQIKSFMRNQETGLDETEDLV